MPKYALGKKCVHCGVLLVEGETAYVAPSTGQVFCRVLVRERNKERARRFRAENPNYYAALRAKRRANGPKPRGGARPGAGRKPLPQDHDGAPIAVPFKSVRIAAVMTGDSAEWRGVAICYNGVSPQPVRRTTTSTYPTGAEARAAAERMLRRSAA